MLLCSENGIQSHKDLQYLQEKDYERMDFMGYEKLRLKEFIFTLSGEEHFLDYIMMTIYRTLCL